MASFSYINPSNQLKKEAKISKIHAVVLEKLLALPVEIRGDKMNMELLKLICCCVENSINNTNKKEKMKINKKDLVIKILNSLFGKVNNVELDTIDKNIEYLIDNNQIIKYNSLVVLSSSLFSWVKKKLD